MTYPTKAIVKTQRPGKGDLEALTALEARLAAVEQQIARLEPAMRDRETEAVGAAFYLGQVGGSNIQRSGLNKRRERSLNRTIAAAVKLRPLYNERDSLIVRIDEIKSGKAQRRADAEAEAARRLPGLLYEQWQAIKPGDEIVVMGARVTVSKKNRKSITTANGVRWSSFEVLGLSGRQIDDLSRAARSNTEGK